MKIQYASDLHLEMWENSRWLKHNPLTVAGDVLVLAGDVMYLGDEALIRHPFWDWASENYKQVLVIPGNHEFYRGWDMNQLTDGWTMEVRENVHYYYNAVVRLDDVELVLTTLWSKIPVRDAFACEYGVTDFKRIMAEGERLNFVRFNNEHERCKTFVRQACEAPLGDGVKRIVVSHHLPSFLLMDSCYKESPLNGAFVCEMYDLIEASQIDYWIYGHSHRNISAQIGQCRCVSNQLGYVSHGEHADFRSDAVIF